MTVDSTDENIFLSSVVNCWLGMEQALLAHGVRCEIRRSTVSGKLGIEIRHPVRFVLVEAWERGQCVDVTIMNAATGESTILSSGPCNTAKDTELRLSAVCEALIHFPSDSVDIASLHAIDAGRTKLRKYDAIVWEGDKPGYRLTLLAQDYTDAKIQIEANHGRGAVVSISNEEDAARTR